MNRFSSVFKCHIASQSPPGSLGVFARPLGDEAGVVVLQAVYRAFTEHVHEFVKINVLLHLRPHFSQARHLLLVIFLLLPFQF